MPPIEATVHPDSLRALAYEVLNQLYGAGPVDDSRITIYQIEAELKHQYGMLLEKDDLQRLRLGQRPDPARVRPQTITLSDADCAECDEFLRRAVLPEYLAWNGQPYITSVSSCGVNFVPVTYTWQLMTVSDRSDRPTFVVEGNYLKVHHTRQTVGVDELEVTGAVKDPFFGYDRNDPYFWQMPLAISENYKAMMKERAEIRLRGGSVATWQRADRKNDSIETPLNQ